MSDHPCSVSSLDNQFYVDGRIEPKRLHRFIHNFMRFDESCHLRTSLDPLKTVLCHYVHCAMCIVHVVNRASNQFGLLFHPILLNHLALLYLMELDHHFNAVCVSDGQLLKILRKDVLLKHGALFSMQCFNLTQL